jgi:hypothetical protein
MAKSKTNARQTVKLLYAAGVALAVACGVLAVMLVKPENGQTLSPDISLGPLTYKIENNRAVKRSDASVRELRTFLEDEAARSGCPADRPGYEYVVAYTDDESQVFLRYGCGAADSPMFAVKQDGAWQTLSPTNQFNVLHIPTCDHVEQNNISPQIAPVCEKTPATVDAPAQYQTR